MRHLLIRSNDGQWAEDQQGRQWVKRPREASDPPCGACLGPDDDGKGPGPVWYAFYDQGGWGRPCAVVVCDKHAAVHWPLDGR